MFKTNQDISNLAKDLDIKNFTGAFMKDALPQKINDVECGIINLQNSNEDGCHWAAYYKNNDIKYYFDSYGCTPPPKQLVKYLGSENLYYNNDPILNYSSPPLSGRLCLIVLKKLSEGDDYETALKTYKADFFKLKKLICL